MKDKLIQDEHHREVAEAAVAKYLQEEHDREVGLQVMRLSGARNLAGPTRRTSTRQRCGLTFRWGHWDALCRSAGDLARPRERIDM